MFHTWLIVKADGLPRPLTVELYRGKSFTEAKRVYNHAVRSALHTSEVREVGFGEVQ